MARVFKTAWFAKEARKARIADSDLCRAINQAMSGQADDLGASDANVAALLNDRELFDFYFKNKIIRRVGATHRGARVGYAHPT